MGLRAPSELKWAPAKRDIGREKTYPLSLSLFSLPGGHEALDSTVWFVSAGVVQVGF